jgi:hypothetical protein
MLTSSASAGTTRHGISFSNVVKATDYGADPTGSSPSDAAVEAATDEDTLVVFPQGEYRFENMIVWTGLSKFGYYGDGDVRFVPPKGYNDRLLSIRTDEFLFEGIDLDLRASNTVAGFRLNVANRLVFEDVEQLGRGTHPDSAVQKFMRADITDTGGVGYIRNVRVEKGSALGQYKAGNGRSCIFVGSKHRGTLKIQSCHFAEFGNNAIYASKTPGDVHVENCSLENNNISSVRLGGGGSYVKNTVVKLDLDRYTGPTDGMTKKFNMRGIWFEHLNRDYEGGAYAEGCSVEIASNLAGRAAGIIVANHVKEVEIRDTVVRVDADNVPGIIRRTPDTPVPFILDNVSVVGAGADDDGILILGTNGSRVRNCCVYLPGTNRNGIRVKEATDCVVRDTNISASERLVTQNASVAMSNLSNDDACPLPGESTDSYDHRIEIRSVGTEDYTKFRFETSGPLAPDKSADSGDSVDGTVASGGVGGGGRDAFLFNGEVVDFNVVRGSASDIEVEVDGAPYEVGSEHTIRIRSVGTENSVGYSFETSGAVTELPAADSGDVIDGTTVTGAVGGGGRDEFGFSGDLVSFDLTRGSPADVAVTVDGTEIEVSDEQFIRIQSVGEEEWVRYYFEASGDVDSGSKADSTDDVTGYSASGGVGGGNVDTYTFAGNLETFVVEKGRLDDLFVTVNGSAVDFTNEIRIEGTGDYVGYEFEASGAVKPTNLADGSDTVKGSVVSGGITAPGVDSYEFSGEIERFELTNGSGGVDVYVNGEPYSI